MDHLLELAIVGRIDAQQVAAFRARLMAAVERGEPFAVLFDRTRLGAPTADGRAALDQLFTHWSQVEAVCVAWADVYDARRAASLARATAARPAQGEGHSSYPQQTFDDLDVARRWLAEQPVPTSP